MDLKREAHQFLLLSNVAEGAAALNFSEWHVCPQSHLAQRALCVIFLIKDTHQVEAKRHARAWQHCCRRRSKASQPIKKSSRLKINLTLNRFPFPLIISPLLHSSMCYNIVRSMQAVVFMSRKRFWNLWFHIILGWLRARQISIFCAAHYRNCKTHSWQWRRASRAEFACSVTVKWADFTKCQMMQHVSPVSCAWRSGGPRRGVTTGGGQRWRVGDRDAGDAPLSRNVEMSVGLLAAGRTISIIDS